MTHLLRPLSYHDPLAPKTQLPLPTECNSVLDDPTTGDTILPETELKW